MAENDVLAIALRGGRKSHEELRRVRVLATVRHGEQPRAIVMQLEPFLLVLKLLSEHTGAARAVKAGVVAALGNKTAHNSMERHALEVHGLVRSFEDPTLACAQLAKVLCRFRRQVIVELDHETPCTQRRRRNKAHRPTLGPARIRRVHLCDRLPARVIEILKRGAESVVPTRFGHVSLPARVRRTLGIELGPIANVHVEKAARAARGHSSESKREM
eukprot:Amastigsp_a509198_26.p2 type:complete len:217 gc:universal Amastigsp_a509198_26:314-964(+)